MTQRSVAQIFGDSAASNDAVLIFHENASQKGNIGYDTSLGGIALVAGSGAFSTADMVLLDGGNVGIGTASPSEKLEVAGNIKIGDSNVMYLGAGNDLQIYHDGSHSYIRDQGSGNLIITGSQLTFSNVADTEYMVKMVQDGMVELYYNGSKKLETTSTGVTVTGAATATTFLGDLNGTINTVTTAVTKANATNDTTVATTAFVQNLIGTIPAGLVFQGTWNAATNTPTLTSGSGTTGHFYIVSTSGSTNLDGVTDWVTGDWAVFIEQGGTDAWEKIDNSSVLDGAGTGQTVAKWDGSGTSNTLTNSSITDTGSAVTISNPTTITGPLTVNIDADDTVVIKSVGTNASAVFAASGDELYLGGGNAYSVRYPAGNNYALFDNSNARVGIGTGNPGNKLHIQDGGSGFAGTFDARNKSIIESNGEAYLATYVPDNSFSGLRFFNSTALKGFIDYYHGTQGNALVYSATGYHKFMTSGTEKVRIINNGNVGIGTTSPSAKLTIDSGSTPQLLLKNSSGTNSKILLEDNSGSTQNASITFDQAGQNNLTIATGYQSSNDENRIYLAPAGNIGLTVRGGTGSNNGNVGIGTTSPTQKLHVVGGSTYAALLDSDQDYTLGLARSGTEEWWLKTYTDGRFAIHENGVGDKVTIKAGGNVGIGTTSPAELLDVAGTARMDTGITEGTHYIGASIAHWGDGDTNIAFSNDDITFKAGDAVMLTINENGTQDKVVVNSNGGDIDFRVEGDGDVNLLFTDASTDKVGVGTSTPQSKLQVAGGIQMAGDTAAASADKVGTMRYRTGTEYVEVNGVELVLTGILLQIRVGQKELGGLFLEVTANCNSEFTTDIYQSLAFSGKHID